MNLKKFFKNKPIQRILKKLLPKVMLSFGLKSKLTNFKGLQWLIFITLFPNEVISFFI